MTHHQHVPYPLSIWPAKDELKPKPEASDHVSHCHTIPPVLVQAVDHVDVIVEVHPTILPKN